MVGQHRNEQSVEATCSACGAQFPDEGQLREHSEMHGNRCPICGSEFTTEALLTDHQRTHVAAPVQEGEIMKQQGERKP